MEEVSQLLSSASKDKPETADKILALLPSAISSEVDDGILGDTVQGIHSWLKSSNTKVFS
jgi:hypothetical protein